MASNLLNSPITVQGILSVVDVTYNHEVDSNVVRAVKRGN
jgi:hypothetical protein